MPSPLTVAVLGASGVQGRAFVRALQYRGHRALGVVRDPSRLPDGVEPRPADPSDPDALAQALGGADAAVVQLSAGVADALAVAQAEAVLEGLRRAETPRAVFNAAGAVWPDPVGVGFLDARRAVALGLADAVGRATVVGPAGPFMENLSEPWTAGPIIRGGVLEQPAPREAPSPWLALGDLARAAVDALESDAPPPRVVMTGPEALTGTETAVVLGRALGQPVRYRQIPFAEYASRLRENLGDPYAHALEAIYGSDAALPPPTPPPPGSVRRGMTTLDEWARRSLKSQLDAQAG